jgi:hypothetical protein
MSKYMNLLIGISLLIVTILSSCAGPTGTLTTPAAPARPCCHIFTSHEVGSGNTELVQAVREGTGLQAEWSKLSETSAMGGRGFADLDEVAIFGASIPGFHEVHFVGLVRGDLVHARQGFDGSWSAISLLSNLVAKGEPGGPLGSDIGREAYFSSVSVSSVNETLHICASEDEGQFEHNQGEGWLDVERASSGENGNFFDVACAGVLNAEKNREELHLCGVTTDGHLWHSINQEESYLPFGDVESQAGEIGNFNRVDCAGNGTVLHLVGVTSAGNVWHTIRTKTGEWRAFEEVRTVASPSNQAFDERILDVAIGFCNEGVPPDAPHDVSQLHIVMKAPLQLFYTIRSANLIHWNESAEPSHWKTIKKIEPGWNPWTNGSPSVAWTVGGFSVASRPFFP